MPDFCARDYCRKLVDDTKVHSSEDDPTTTIYFASEDAIPTIPVLGQESNSDSWRTSSIIFAQRPLADGGAAADLFTTVVLDDSSLQLRVDESDGRQKRAVKLSCLLHKRPATRCQSKTQTKDGVWPAIVESLLISSAPPYTPRCE